MASAGVLHIVPSLVGVFFKMMMLTLILWYVDVDVDVDVDVRPDPHHNVQEEKTRIGISVWPRHLSGITAALQYNTRNDDGDKRLVR